MDRIIRLDICENSKCSFYMKYHEHLFWKLKAPKISVSE